jgi:hypothetical protein
LLDNKDYGKILLIIGIASLLVGIGVGIYSLMFSISTYSNTIPANTVPAWFGNVIAVTLAILGIVLIVLGARELGFHYFDSDAKT